MKYSTILAGIACSFSVLMMSAQAQAETTRALEGKWYIYGDFNNWQVPTTSDTNGALKLEQNENYDNLFYIKTDKLNGSSFKVTNLNGTVQYGTEFPPFTIYQSQNGDLDLLDIPLTIVKRGSEAKDQAITILNEGDYTVEFLFNPTSLGLFTIGVKDAPVMELPQEVYAVTRTDDNKGTQDLVGNEYPVYWYAGVPDEKKASKIYVLFSTKSSSTLPAVHHNWGFKDKTAIVYDDSNTSGYYQLVEGGNIMEFDYPGEDEGGVWVCARPLCGIVQVSMIKHIKYLYLVGYQDGWNAPIAANADKLIKLEETTSNVYEADVDCPYSEPDAMDGRSLMQFRFFKGLAGWVNYYSLGALPEDYTMLGVDMSEGEQTFDIVNGGLGNWGLDNWDGGEVHFKVDLNNQYKLTVTPKTNAVENIELSSEQQPAVYYNLQGLRVENPANGIFIKVQGGKSQKLHLH